MYRGETHLPRRTAMATGTMNGVLQRLREVMQPDPALTTDGQLLEHYLARRDEAAFAALVRRHGPMVLGVCRRVLGHEQDAEDAFQATFLVLVRKASTVRPRAMVGNWLHGVAYRTAHHAQRLAARRRRKEHTMARREIAPAAAPDELAAILDRELDALPAKYRAVLVLCDLEGKTRQEAAGHLGCPAGTVGGRLARARALLARRLTRRGGTLSGGAAAALAPSAAAAQVPPALFAGTVQAAQLFAAGSAAVAGTVSSKVVTLTEGVLKAMFLSKLKIASGILAAVALVCVAAGGLESRAPAQTDQQPATVQTDKGPAQGKKAEAPPADTRALNDKAKKLVGHLYEDPMTFIHNSRNHYCTSCHQVPMLGQASQFHLRLDIEKSLQKFDRTSDRDREAALDALEDIERAIQDLRKHLRKRRDK